MRMFSYLNYTYSCVLDVAQCVSLWMLVIILQNRRTAFKSISWPTLFLKFYFLRSLIPRGEMMISPCAQSFSLSWIPYIIHAVFCLSSHQLDSPTPTLPFTFPKQHVRAYTARTYTIIYCVYIHAYILLWLVVTGRHWSNKQPGRRSYEEGMRTLHYGFSFFSFFKYTFHCY